MCTSAHAQVEIGHTRKKQLKVSMFSKHSNPHALSPSPVGPRAELGQSILNSSYSAPRLHEHILVRCPHQFTMSVTAKVVVTRWYFPMMLLWAVGGGLARLLQNEQIEVSSARGRTLMRLNAAFAGTGMVVQCLPLPSLKAVMRKQSGSLAQLGIHHVHISRTAAKTINKCAMLYSLPALVLSTYGLGAIFWAVWHLLVSGSITMLDGSFYIFVGLYCCCGSPVSCACMFSMVIGAELANRKIRDMIDLIEKTSPSDTNWAQVERLASSLARDTMPCVSKGWETLAISIIACYWLFGFSELVYWLYEPSLPWALATVGFWAVSTLVVLPLAITSTNCDKLMVALNDKRLDFGNRENHNAIQCVETAFRRLNLDQGLGYTIGAPEPI